MTPEEEKINDAVRVAPHLHKIIFESERIRVLKVRIEPGQRAEMHWHPENINYVVSPGKLRFTKPDGSVAEVMLTVGQITSSKAGSHIVENTGDTEVQTIQVELKE